MRAVPVQLALTNLGLATCTVPSRLSGGLPARRTSRLLLRMYPTVRVSHRSVIEINAKQVHCRIVVRNACMLCLILACLKLHAIVLTGAEQDVGVEIATNSKL